MTNITLCTDIVFKTLWLKGSDDVRRYLDRMIEYTIGKSIKDYTLGSNETGIISFKSIANEVDILLVSLDHRTKINVEMNNLGSRSSKQNRISAMNKSDIYLGSYINSFYNDLPKDERYKGEIKVEQVNFNNFYFDENKLISELHFSFMDKNYDISKNGVRSHQIYLPRMKELCYDVDEDIYKDFALLTAKDIKEMKALAKGNKEREAVVEYLKWLGRDEDFMAIIDREEYNRIQMQTTIDHEKELAIQEGLAEGRKQGIEQGIQEGIEQGIQEGIEQGIQEGIKQNKKEAAINLFNNGVSKDVIIKSLNITLEELEEILKEV